MAQMASDGIDFAFFLGRLSDATRIDTPASAKTPRRARVNFGHRFKPVCGQNKPSDLPLEIYGDRETYVLTW
jgi:hypothetical protein